MPASRSKSSLKPFRIRGIRTKRFLCTIFDVIFVVCVSPKKKNSVDFGSRYLLSGALRLSLGSSLNRCEVVARNMLKGKTELNSTENLTGRKNLKNAV